ncbi:hypothetical protein STCU_12137 [Strigomonas culicis]|uniref:Uncharacterized protein n=1 Tax=Strigomonas culicis TaxID=28005 RepID=S9UKV3_9TRYP|nr:hypothetical protein STCU_12137 [Strigomonas culicis]|eukprot:EPY15306.1 hypothetical protein STCU_12137 [Strigomonas culicis]
MERALQAHQARVERRVLRSCMHHWYRAMFLARTRPAPLLALQPTRSATAPPPATPPRAAPAESAAPSPIQAEPAGTSQSTSCVAAPLHPPPPLQLVFTNTVKGYELQQPRTAAEREVEVTRTDISWFLQPLRHPSQRSQGASSSSAASSERRAAAEAPQRVLHFDPREDEAHRIRVLAARPAGADDASCSGSSRSTRSRGSGSDDSRGRHLLRACLAEDADVRALLAKLPTSTRGRVEALLRPDTAADGRRAPPSDSSDTTAARRQQEPAVPPPPAAPEGPPEAAHHYAGGAPPPVAYASRWPGPRGAAAGAAVHQ